MKTVNDFAFYLTFSLQNGNRSNCRSRWENLDRGQYPFQPIKFMNLVDPSPCETKPYNKALYYPTALRRVQITLKTSTNITHYLYSRGPVRQVSYHWLISKLDFPRQFRSASHTSIAFSLWINIHEIRSHEHTSLACWIINLLLDVLLCGIAENFYSKIVMPLKIIMLLLKEMVSLRGVNKVQAMPTK